MYPYVDYEIDVKNVSKTALRCRVPVVIYSANKDSRKIEGVISEKMERIVLRPNERKKSWEEPLVNI